MRKTIDSRVLNFCCAGCLQVYELQRLEGRRPRPHTQGTQARVQPEPRSGADPEPGEANSSRIIILSIGGLTCANCVAHVEGALRSVAGVLNASANGATGRAAVEFIAGVVEMADLKEAVTSSGYEVLGISDTG